MKYKFCVIFFFIFHVFITSQSNAKDFDFFEFSEVFIEENEKINDSINDIATDLPKILSNIKNEISQKVNIQKIEEPDMRSLVLWLILLRESAYNNIGSITNDTSKFLLESSYFLNIYSKMYYNGNDIAENNSYNYLLSNFYYYYAAIVMLSDKSDLWIVDINNNQIRNNNSKVIDYFKKSIEAVEKISYYSFLNDKLTFLDKSVVNSSGKAISQDDYYDLVNLYFEVALQLLNQYAYLDNKDKHQSLFEKILVTIQNNNDYPYLTTDEIFVSLFFGDIKTMIYIYTPDEYIEILQNLKNINKKNLETPISNFDINAELFSAYFHIEKHDLAFKAFKEISPEIDKLSIPGEVNLYLTYLALKLESSEDYEDWVLQMENIILRSLTLIPYLKDSGQLNGAMLLYEIHKYYNLFDFNETDQEFLEATIKLIENTNNFPKEVLVFLKIEQTNKLFENHTFKEKIFGIDEIINLYDEWKLLSPNPEFVLNTETKPIIAYFVGNIVSTFIELENFPKAKFYLDELKLIENGRHYFGSYSTYCKKIGDIKCRIDNFKKLVDLTINEYDQLREAEKIVMAASYTTTIADEYFALASIMEDAGNYNIKEIFHYQDKAIQYLIKGFEISNRLEGLFNTGYQYDYFTNSRYFYLDSYLNNFFIIHSNPVSLSKLGIELQYEPKDNEEQIIKYVINNYTAETYPVIRVSDINKNSYLYKSGLREDDLILNINNNDLYASSIFDTALYINFEEHISTFLRASSENSISFLKNNKIDKSLNIHETHTIKININEADKTNYFLDHEVIERAFYISQILISTDASTAINKLTNRIILNKDHDPKLIKKRQDLKKEIKDLSDLLFVEVDFLTDDEINIKRDELKNLQKKLYKVDSFITSSTLKNNIINQQIYRLNDVANLLSSDEILIINFSQKRSHYAWGITSTGTFVFNKFYPLTEEKAYGFFGVEHGNEQFRSVIDYKIYGKEYFAKKYNHPIEISEDFWTDYLLNGYSEGMYKMILEPFNDILIEGNEIIFLSTGEYFSQIPYKLLKDPSKNDYFGDEFTTKNIVSLNSLEIRSMNTISEKNLKFLGIGNPYLGDANRNMTKKSNFTQLVQNLFRGLEVADRNILQKFEPLPESETELITISKNFDIANTKLLLQKDASEKKVRSMNLSEWDIINFSTHTINGYGLSEPGLILSLPDESTFEDDGVLVASEIAELNLNAKLVVLSACNTAAAKDTDSEILSGLAQAFLYAGAENLILSHWPVEDRSTAILMSKFYDLWLNKGNAPADALKLAQKEVMQMPQYSHPVYWAGFSYYGL